MANLKVNKNVLPVDDPDIEQFIGKDHSELEPLNIGDETSERVDRISRPEMDAEDIESALDAFSNNEDDIEHTKAELARIKSAELHRKASENLKAEGIKKAKNSKFPTRSDTFLNDPVSDRGVYIILNQHRSDIYKDGVDPLPRLLLGIPAWNKSCTKNAFEHLINVQKKLKDARADNPKGYPEWIIISVDSSLVMDRDLVNRLNTLKPETHIAGAYGFRSCPRSGAWFDPAPDTPDTEFRGCYIQGSMDNLNWHFNVGSGFKDRDRCPVTIIHGPYIAVRGATFMDLNFNTFASKMKGGFYHFMADISMQLHGRFLKAEKRNYFAAQISSPCMQYDNIRNHMDKADFIHDQSLFVSKWQKFLPAKL